VDLSQGSPGVFTVMETGDPRNEPRFSQGRVDIHVHFFYCQ
jgi:hypothetical protein